MAHIHNLDMFMTCTRQCLTTEIWQEASLTWIQALKKTAMHQSTTESIQGLKVENKDSIRIEVTNDTSWNYNKETIREGNSMIRFRKESTWNATHNIACLHPLFPWKVPFLTYSGDKAATLVSTFQQDNGMYTETIPIPQTINIHSWINTLPTNMLTDQSTSHAPLLYQLRTVLMDKCADTMICSNGSHHMLHKSLSYIKITKLRGEEEKCLTSSSFSSLLASMTASSCSEISSACS